MLRIINPYPGFENGFYKPFTENESNLFFGRSQEISGIKLRLRQKKLVCLVSEPKTGVTSLLRAGLIPNLRKNKFDGINGGDWRCVYMHPGDDPILSLAQAIVNPYNRLSNKLKPSMEEDVYNRLLKNDYGLLRVFEQILGDQQFNILLIIDDFYESFSKMVDSKTSRKFLNLLYKLYIDKSLPFYMLFSIKTNDYRGEDIKSHEKLFKAISAGLFKVKFLNKDGLKKAIEMPAQFGQSQIDTDLSKELVIELIQDNDQLRKLQLLMSRTWYEWKRKHKTKVVDKQHFFKATGQKAKAISKGLTKSGSMSLTENGGKGTSKSSILELSKVDFDKLSDKEKSWFKVLIPQLLKKEKDKLHSHPMDLKHALELLDIDMDKLGSFATQIPTIVAMDERKISIQNIDVFNDWKEVKEWVDQEAVLKQKFVELADAAILHYIEGIDVQSVISRAQYNDIFEWYDPSLLTPAWAMHQHDNYELGLDFIDKLQEIYGPVKKRKKIKKNPAIKIGGGSDQKTSKIKIGGSDDSSNDQKQEEQKEEKPAELGSAADEKAKEEALKILEMSESDADESKATDQPIEDSVEEKKKVTIKSKGKLKITAKGKSKTEQQPAKSEEKPKEEEEKPAKKKIVIKKK